MAQPASMNVVITGLVQGVMFRDFTCRNARALGLAGFARNLPGGQAVEVQAEGERSKLEKLLVALKQGPPRAVVEKVKATWGEYTGSYYDFEVKY